MEYRQQDLRSTRDAEEHSPSAGPVDTYPLAAAAPSSTHTRTHALCQSDYHTPCSVTARVERDEKREPPVVSPRHRRGNAANGRNPRQWP